jgi:hypothetical protein
LPKTTSEQGAGGDPQCTRGFEPCGDAAIRPHRVDEADARVRLVVPMPMSCALEPHPAGRGPDV